VGNDESKQLIEDNFNERQNSNQTTRQEDFREREDEGAEDNLEVGFIEIEEPKLHSLLAALHKDIYKIKLASKGIIDSAKKDVVLKIKDSLDKIDVLQKKLFGDEADSADSNEVFEQLVISDPSSEEIHELNELTFQTNQLEFLDNPETIILNSFYLYIFSCYEAFSGPFLKELYKLHPDSFNSSDKEVSVKEILSYSSFEDFQDSILEKEVESFRRDSYEQQFKYLESKFSIDTLRKFDNWGSFVECAQRRNLFTHCDGIVSQQYITTCQKAGYKFSTIPNIGDQLSISYDYFEISCDLLLEVATKLTHTLWRKLAKDKLSEADTCLGELVYENLERQNWSLSKLLAKFHLEQKIHSNQTTRYLACINLAIAYNQLGESKCVTITLEKLEWEIVAYDFRIARHILLNEFKEAVVLMMKMGKRGELTYKECYHAWPIFEVNGFKYSAEFLKTYREIYLEDFYQGGKTDALHLPL
jgi:hypothetical protein